MVMILPQIFKCDNMMLDIFYVGEHFDSLFLWKLLYIIGSPGFTYHGKKVTYHHDLYVITNPNKRRFSYEDELHLSCYL